MEKEEVEKQKDEEGLSPQVSDLSAFVLLYVDKL